MSSLRRIVDVPPAVAEETVISTPSTSAEAVEDDAPPVISRFDTSTYPPSSPPSATVPQRIVLNRAAPPPNTQKVLLIRREDGTRQFFRPVSDTPGRVVEPVNRVGGEIAPPVRRVVTSVPGRPGTIVRTVAAPTRVVRVGPGGQQIVNRLSGTRVVATRTPSGMVDAHPILRQPAAVQQQQTRVVQRVGTRGGATMAMGQRIVQSHFQEDVGLTRPLKNPREFPYKQRVPEAARQPYSSRTYRFDFESNEDEERAIAEAIAREEELMAQEEEENKTNQDRQWNYPRIIDKFGQVGSAMLHQLSKQPLQYNSNLIPTKEDTTEQKLIKQTLDSLITQVCRWDKQYGWFKNHQRRPKSKVEMDRLKSRRMFSNQRELMLAEHVERLRREINKRRTRLENEAEQLCGLQTPWRKIKNKSTKPKRPAKKAAPNAPIVNPAEISLGGDSIDWMKKDIKVEDDELIEDVSSQPPIKRTRHEIEAASSPRRKAPSVPRSDRVLRTRMNSHSSVEENSSKKDAPKKRGRPKKEVLSSQDSEDSDTAGVDYGIPEGMTDPKGPHCVCRKPYNSKRFYISCDLCNGWFHGKCVGVKSQDCESLNSWCCPDCDQQSNQAQKDLYCLCQKPYDDREFYVGCDKCEDWFHPECVGITKEYAESIAEYVCPPCRTMAEQTTTDGYESTASEASTSSNSPPLSRADYPKVWHLLDTITHHKMAWPFKEPVDLEKYPDYTDLVKKPMDLKTIHSKLERLEYIKLKDFSYDINLMFENARIYNSKDSPIYLCATTLEKIFDENLIELKREMANAFSLDRRKPSESHTVDSSLDIDTDQLIELQHGIDHGSFDITQYI